MESTEPGGCRLPPHNGERLRQGKCELSVRSGHPTYTITGENSTLSQSGVTHKPIRNGLETNIVPKFMGEIVGGTIIFGDPGTEPILGVTALESVGIEVNPQDQTLKRLPAARLKKLRPKLRCGFQA
jgi:hypothetical protein